MRHGLVAPERTGASYTPRAMALVLEWRVLEPFGVMRRVGLCVKDLMR